MAAAQQVGGLVRPTVAVVVLLAAAAVRLVVVVVRLVVVLRPAEGPSYQAEVRPSCQAGAHPWLAGHLALVDQAVRQVHSVAARLSVWQHQQCRRPTCAWRWWVLSERQCVC